MNRLAVGLGLMILAASLVALPMPLTTELENPMRIVTIYPNALFAFPLILLAVLLLLYGLTVNDQRQRSDGYE